MDPIAAYHGLTDAVVAFAGGSDKLVHTHVGMAAFLGAQLVLRTRRGSIDALLFVVLLEAGNEAMDRLYFGSWRWADTLGDIAATLTWPTLVVLAGRWRRRRWALAERARRDTRALGALMGRVPARTGAR